MKTSPVISIVVPCFNSGKTIGRTLKSLEFQTYENIEVIIVNDGSNDELTLKKLHDIPKSLKAKIINQKNSGLSAARNRGIEAANGNFIIPLDADDWLEPDAISMLVREALFEGSRAIVYSDINLHGDRNGIKQTYCNPFEQLFSNQLPYCMLIPKVALEKLNGYDENFDLGFEDWELNLRLIQEGYVFKKINRAVFNYQVSEKGMLKAKSLRNFAFIAEKIRNKHPQEFHLKSLVKKYKCSTKLDSKYPLFIFIVVDLLFKLFPIQFVNHLYNFGFNATKSKSHAI